MPGHSRPLLSTLNTAADLFQSPQFEDREFFAEVEHPAAGLQRHPGLPVRLGSGQRLEAAPAPLLGQDNQAVLGKKGLGLTHSRIGPAARRRHHLAGQHPCIHGWNAPLRRCRVSAPPAAPSRRSSRELSDTALRPRHPCCQHRVPDNAGNGPRRLFPHHCRNPSPNPAWMKGAFSVPAFTLSSSR